MGEINRIFVNRGGNPIAASLQGLGQSIGGALQSQATRRTQALQGDLQIREQERALRALELEGQQAIATQELALETQRARERGALAELGQREARIDIERGRLAVAERQADTQAKDQASLAQLRTLQGQLAEANAKLAQARTGLVGAQTQQAEAQAGLLGAQEADLAQQTKLRQQISDLTVSLPTLQQILAGSNPSPATMNVVSGMLEALRQNGLVDENTRVRLGMAVPIAQSIDEIVKATGIERPPTQQQIAEQAMGIASDLAEAQVIGPGEIGSVGTLLTAELMKLYTDPEGAVRELQRYNTLFDSVAKRSGFNPDALTPEQRQIVERAVREELRAPVPEPEPTTIPGAAPGPALAPVAPRPPLQTRNVSDVQDILAQAARVRNTPAAAGGGPRAAAVAQQQLSVALQALGIPEPVAQQAVAETIRTGSAEAGLALIGGADPRAAATLQAASIAEQARQAERMFEAKMRAMPPRMLQVLRDGIASGRFSVQQAIEQLQRNPGFTEPEARRALELGP